MTKFKFERINNKKAGLFSTAIHNIQNELLNGRYNIQDILKKQAKKCNLTEEELLQKTIKTLKKENNGIIPKDLEKYEKVNSKL